MMIIIIMLTVMAPPPMPATTLVMMLMLVRLVAAATVRQLHTLPELREEVNDPSIAPPAVSGFQIVPPSAQPGR